MADDIRDCRDLEVHFAPYVDGEETPVARRGVDAHLAACPPCRRLAEVERSARDLVREHRHVLCGRAPQALRSRCARLQRSAVSSRPSMLRKWAPLSLAASLVLAVAGVFVFGLNNRVEALAASLAVDHVKCFKLSGTEGRAEAAGAERQWQQDQGWAITVPQSEPSQRLTLVDVRRCFSTDGRTAHMMYTWRGAPLSVYVLQGEVGENRVVQKMGTEAVIWCANRRTYAVVAGGHPPDLVEIATYIKARVQ
jgi:anti-sigma factor RsiW